jgi:arabinofuranan 3-O-arabinosyltransferase
MTRRITRAATRTVIVYGSGDGIIDAAAAGLLDGHEAVLYAADLTDDELLAWADASALFLLTDSNRDRAHQWRGSQDVWGFTETGGPAVDVLRFDAQDARFPMFAEELATDQTTAAPDGGVTVRATSYGSPVRYLPAQRPAMAVDGDPATAWKVGVDGPPSASRYPLHGGRAASCSPRRHRSPVPASTTPTVTARSNSGADDARRQAVAAR